MRKTSRRRKMNKNKDSEKPKGSSEKSSFDSDGPWANAWHVDPQTFSKNENQMRMDSRESDKSKRCSRGHSTSS
jgi:hypothetical protein